MHRLLRIALTWLLVLALPVQGHAAQAMLFCGPLHHGSAAPAAPQSTAHAHAHAAQGHGPAQAVGAHAHHEAVALSDGAGEPAPQDAAVKATGHGDAGADGTTPAGKCSVCASCCGMAVLAGAVLLPGSPALAGDYAPTSFEPHAGRTAGGLERPPKAFLA